MSTSSLNLNINSKNSTEYSTQLYTNSTNHQTNSTNHIIPKVPNPFKRSNSRPNFSNSEVKYNIFSSSPNDNQQIINLKKSFKTRIVQLISNLQTCVSKLTPYNASDLINEQIFLEKENAIALLYEENASIKVEYEENKNEMDRLQKIISVLEIDLHKYDTKNNELTQKNQSLSNDNYTLQAENFDYSLKLKNYINKTQSQQSQAASNELETIAELKENYNAMYNELQETLEQTKKDAENNTLVIKKDYQNKLDDYRQIITQLRSEMKEKDEIMKGTESKLNELHELNTILEQDNSIYQVNNERLKVKIFSLKHEIETIRTLTVGEINKMNLDNQAIQSKIISIFKEKLLEKLKGDNKNKEKIELELKKTEEKYEKMLMEQFRKTERLQKENNAFNETIIKMQTQIKTLTNKLNDLDCENKGLSTTVTKFTIEIGILNDTLTSKKEIIVNMDKIYQNSLKEIKKSLKEKMRLIQLSYIKEITKLKSMVNSLVSFNNNEEDNNNKPRVIQLENLITALKMRLNDYEKIFIKKEKKIKVLQTALTPSLLDSFSTGRKNIKIANLLDDEVKSLMKKTKGDENFKKK